jgi:hypothetical protein
MLPQSGLDVSHCVHCARSGTRDTNSLNLVLREVAFHLHVASYVFIVRRETTEDNYSTACI